MKIVNDFFNKACSDIDKKYFPDVKYYGDKKETTDIHYAVELFNNGVIGYNELLDKVSLACKVSHEEIHNIISKHVESFGNLEFKFVNGVFHYKANNFNYHEYKPEEIGHPLGTIYKKGKTSEYGFVANGYDWFCFKIKAIKKTI